MDSQLAGELKRAYQTARLIGIVMMGSLVVFAALAEMIRSANAPFRGFAPLPEIHVLRYVLLAFSMANFFLIRWLSDVVRSGKVKLQQGFTPTTPSSTHIQRLPASAIVGYALCEAVGVYGLLLFLLEGRSSDLYGFLGLSVVLYAIYFPRYGQWEEWMREVERAG